MKFTIGKILMLFVALSVIAGNAYGDPVCDLLLGPSGNPPLNYQSFQGMLGMSFLLIAIMASVAGVAYGLGRGFGFGKLVSFATTELGEIALTCVIVVIFLGSFSLVGGTSVGGLFDPGYSTFSNVCAKLTGSSYALLPPLLGISLGYDAVSLAQSFSVSLEPNTFGFSFTPFSGLSLVVNVLNVFVAFVSGMIAFLLGFAVALVIIYRVFPLFLFAGIILRTIPFTRAAGGSFLGLFIGFYVFLPLFLNFMLVSVTPRSFTQNPLSTLSSAPQSAISDIITLISPSPVSIVTFLISNMIVPVMYTLFAVGVTLLLSFDFTESVGDLLGAPSLSSQHTLRKII